MFEQPTISYFSHCLLSLNSNKSSSHRTANNLPNLADTGGRSMCVHTAFVDAHTHRIHPQSHAALVYLSPCPTPHCVSRAEILYAFKLRLSILCVCVCLPLW